MIVRHVIAWCVLSVGLCLMGGQAWAGLPGEITGKDGASMLLVPEGEFLYGESDERTAMA